MSSQIHSQISSQISSQIYLDYNASTPIAEPVAAVMRPLLESAFGNPSSGHWAGAPAKRIVEEAREKVAALIGADPSEVVFTSGGSESNNTAIKGAALPGGHVVTTSTEHPATLESCRFVERAGGRVTIVGVDRFGQVTPEAIGEAVTGETRVVTVMHANNETGTIQPIGEIAKRKGNAQLHCDAAQSAGKIPVKVDDLGVDTLSLAGHKLYAPKGIGALYIRRGTKLEPLIHGGGHESGRRAGTESALMAAALGEACRLAAEAVERWADLVRLRDRLHHGLIEKLGERIVLNGHPTDRLPNTLNVSFVGRVGADVLASLPGVAASTGSACHEGSVSLSPVLAAMGVDPAIGQGAVRFSLGRDTTEAEIDAVLAMF